MAVGGFGVYEIFVSNQASDVGADSLCPSLLAYLQVVRMRVAEEQKKTCPHCGSAALRSESTDRRVVPTKGGQVLLALHRMRCQSCQQRFRPAECSNLQLRQGSIWTNCT